MKDSIKQEINTSIKVVLLGLFISCVFYFLINPFILTILYFTNLNISTFLNMCIYFDLMIYSSISLAGIYVGISKGEKKLLLAAIIGLLFYPVTRLILILAGNQGHFNLLNFILNFLRYGFICMMFSWLSNMISLKFKKNNNSGANCQ